MQESPHFEYVLFFWVVSDASEPCHPPKHAEQLRHLLPRLSLAVPAFQSQSVVPCAKTLPGNPVNQFTNLNAKSTKPWDSPVRLLRSAQTSVRPNTESPNVCQIATGKFLHTCFRARYVLTIRNRKITRDGGLLRCSRHLDMKLDTKELGS